MGASQSEPEVATDLEKPDPVIPEPIDPDDGMYEIPDIEMDWFWPFI
jgi:hypothetical protein